MSARPRAKKISMNIKTVVASDAQPQEGLGTDGDLDMPEALVYPATVETSPSDVHAMEVETAAAVPERPPLIVQINSQQNEVCLALRSRLQDHQREGVAWLRERLCPDQSPP